MKRFSQISILLFTIFSLAFLLSCDEVDISKGTPSDPTESCGEWPLFKMVERFSGLEAPVLITSPKDGSGRLFIVEQIGKVKVVKDGQIQSELFLDISDLIKYRGEQGLLSIVFPPNYSQKGYFYVNYIRDYKFRKDRATVIARYYLDPNNLDKADKNSAEKIRTFKQPYVNHNGGMMLFGPDGYLYISSGDGGGAGDPDRSGQNINTLLGKMLRIDTESGVKPYAIPPDNPYTRFQGMRPEIWSYGLRNPWRFWIDMPTGDIYIGDVGQYDWEEINYQPGDSIGGENYGWNIMEGKHCYAVPQCNRAGKKLPVWEYSHAEGCSVTGGIVYRGENECANGFYFFGDYCSGKIYALKQTEAGWEAKVVMETDMRIVSFGEGPNGEMYVVDLQGTINELIPVYSERE